VAADPLGKQCLKARWIVNDEIALKNCIGAFRGTALAGRAQALEAGEAYT
jgi:hypothetical protein